MGTKLLLGFGGTVIQVVVHQNQAKLQLARGFWTTVNQEVAHQEKNPGYSASVSEVPQTKQ